MCSLKEYLSVLEEFCPLYLSEEMKKTGMHDNSGIIIDAGKQVKKVLFSLDFSLNAVNRAKGLGADTIVTHHPAIYTPLYNLSEQAEESRAVFYAVKYGINVISMHLNLDIANGGIDDSLALVLGSKDAKTICNVYNGLGYGKEFNIEETDFNSFVNSVKQTFKTKKVIAYKNGAKKVSQVASFCGGGASSAVEFLKNNSCFNGVIVTSDLSHHHIVEILERGASLVIIPHYVSEEKGFYIFYNQIKNKQKNIESFYFNDKRFI